MTAGTAPPIGSDADAAGSAAAGVLDGTMGADDACRRFGTTAIAEALRAAAQSAWVTDPVRARAAADTLRALCRPLADPSAAGDRGRLEILANADWAEGIARLAEGELAGGKAALEAAAGQWQALLQPLPAAQALLATVMPLSLMGRFDEALQVGSACERVLDAQGDTIGAAKAALNLGSLSLHRDRYAEGAAHYRRAAVRFARAGDRRHSIMADIGLGQALGHAGELDEARRIHDRAGMRATQHELPVLAAQAAHGVALVDLAQGRYGPALAGLVNAQQAFASLGVDHYRIEVERDLADAYLELRLWPEALGLYEHLLVHLQAQGNAATLPWLRLQRARALAGAGQSEAACRELERSRGEFLADGNEPGLARAGLALLDLAVGLAAPDDVETAALHAGQAEALAAAPALTPGGTAHARWLQARALLRQGQSDAAETLLRGLCDSVSPGSSPALRTRAWTAIGEMAWACAARKKAVSAWEEAISESEATISALPSEESRFAAFGEQLQAYRHRLHAALAQRDPSEVLRWLDRQRARVLAERFAQVPGTPAGVPDGVAAARARLEWLRRQQQRRLEDDDRDGAAVLESEMHAFERELLETWRRHRAMHDMPGVTAERSGNGTRLLDVDALRRHFCHGRALVSYGFDADRLFAVVVAEGEVRLCPALADRPVLLAALEGLDFQLQTWRAGTAALARHAQQLHERTVRRLQSLHRLLWAPLQPLLGQAAEVCVIVAEGLHALPFAALHDGTGWLDDTVTLRTAPSAALSLPRAVASPLEAGPSLLVGTSVGLPHVAHELAAASEALDGARVLIDSDARVADVLAAMPQARLLHLAGHAEFRSDAPAFSALQLHDGRLTVADLEPLQLARVPASGVSPSVRGKTRRVKPAGRNP